MSEAAAIELRVLRGPQAGCRLPLSAGLYRAGADESCDILLEGPAEGESGFVLYVGHKALALESLGAGVRIDGKPASGLRELAKGRVFELGPWLFVVDDTSAPWPEDTEALLANTSPPAETDGLAGEPLSEGSPESTAGVTAVPAEAVDAGAEVSDIDALDTTPTEAVSAPADAPVPRRARRALPFWVLGLIGTAVFLGCGVLTLALSLAPQAPRPVPEAAPLQRTLAQIIESAGPEGDVRLEPMPGGRIRLTGFTSTRQQRTALIREARAVDPAVLVRLITDEDLESQARDALTRFADLRVTLAGVHLGRITLKGHVNSGEVRDQITAAIRDGVAGFGELDNQITANDDALIALRERLASAGLAQMLVVRLDRGDGSRLLVEGAPDEAARAAWQTVRGELVAQFGESLEIIERFQAKPVARKPRGASRDDVVVVVMGPMPYVVLENGSKVARSAAVEREP